MGAQLDVRAAPPYFDGMSREPAGFGDVKGARVLVWLGDSVTTDHISPAGAISLDSPAGEYLLEHGVERKDFNTYGARRGNHEVMIRGTFANVRLRNKLVPGSEGTWTEHVPSGEEMTIYGPRSGTSPKGRRPSCSRARSTARARHAIGPRRAEPARGESGDRRVVRADPSLEPVDDGCAAAAVHGRRDTGARSGSPAASRYRSRASRTARPTK